MPGSAPVDDASGRLDGFFAAVALECLAGVGHFPPLEAPDRFAAALREACGA